MIVKSCSDIYKLQNLLKSIYTGYATEVLFRSG